MLMALIISQSTDNLHPMFMMSKEAAVKCYELGRKDKDVKRVAKRLDLFDNDIGKVRSPVGVSWTAPHVIFWAPSASIYSVGARDAREYRPSNTDQFNPPKEKPDLLKVRVYFTVNLYAWPGISDLDGSITRDAIQSDVRDVKFVLLIDGDPEKPVFPSVTPDPTSTESHDGTVKVPEYNTVTQNSSGSATVIGDGGSATAWARSTSTVTYVTHHEEAYNWHHAKYELKFPLYNDRGQPNITKDTKKLVLKVVRGSGEHTGTWDLEKLGKVFK